ncbi:hypothetical protein [Oceanicaulis sp. MMSF_3324]|uniref:hypothetical protein n=1 Tax=Oceanicaulis sp. MMSF_3324 TaxID=3046702 RepID=UPI00273E6FBB|nr:hypothetical protein [Oceanicaulis sp. MMSF_3324]
MPMPGETLQIIEKTLDGGISYTAIIGYTMKPILETAVEGYSRKIRDHDVLIVDYRKGGPILEPQDYPEFFQRVGDVWDKPDHFIYLYNDANRMRTAHLSKMILMRGGKAIALPSWEAAAEHLGRELGDDPLEGL